MNYIVYFIIIDSSYPCRASSDTDHLIPASSDTDIIPVFG
jgi:hypothetical protein